MKFHTHHATPHVNQPTDIALDIQREFKECLTTARILVANDKHRAQPEQYLARVLSARQTASQGRSRCLDRGVWTGPKSRMYAAADVSRLRAGGNLIVQDLITVKIKRNQSPFRITDVRRNSRWDVADAALCRSLGPMTENQIRPAVN